MPVPPRPLRAAQLILLALALGVLSFGVVAITLRPSLQPSSPETGRLLAVVLVGLGVCEGAVYFLLRRGVLQRLAAEREQALTLVLQGALPPQLLTLTIIGGALAESIGLLGSVAYLVGAPALVIAAPVLSVALILVQVPTRARTEYLVRSLENA